MNGGCSSKKYVPVNVFQLENLLESRKAFWWNGLSDCSKTGSRMSKNYWNRVKHSGRMVCWFCSSCSSKKGFIISIICTRGGLVVQNDQNEQNKKISIYIRESTGTLEHFNIKR